MSHSPPSNALTRHTPLIEFQDSVEAHNPLRWNLMEFKPQQSYPSRQTSQWRRHRNKMSEKEQAPEPQSSNTCTCVHSPHKTIVPLCNTHRNVNSEYQKASWTLQERRGFSFIHSTVWKHPPLTGFIGIIFKSLFLAKARWARTLSLHIISSNSNKELWVNICQPNRTTASFNTKPL
jgi:hypothetical protein